MINDTTNKLSLGTAIGRWSGLGPYYAMFPKEFAFHVVENYSNPGDAIIDPFAGRFSSVYAAAAMERSGIGIEINPVGWLYGFVKMKPALKVNVVKRIKNIGNLASCIEMQALKALPEFFHCCYSPNVLGYLLTARNELCWKNSRVDATLMSIILVHLHGKRDQSLSNQMRQGKSMSPDYSINWWKEKQLIPPEIDPVEYLLKRIEWRYAKGTPNLINGKVILGDSTSFMEKLKKKVSCSKQKPFNLLFTSPPYYKLTNYHYDQWLRIWMLGGSNIPIWNSDKWQNRFESKIAYRELLEQVFSQCAEVMDNKATIYVRTDAREFTKQTTLEVLREIFPEKSIQIVLQPYKKNTQTALFGDKSQKPGEIDIIMQS